MTSHGKAVMSNLIDSAIQDEAMRRSRVAIYKVGCKNGFSVKPN